MKKYYIYDDISKRYVCRYATGGIHLSKINPWRRVPSWYEIKRMEFTETRARTIIANYKTLNWPEYQKVDGNRPRMALRMVKARRH